MRERYSRFQRKYCILFFTAAWSTTKRNLTNKKNGESTATKTDFTWTISGNKSTNYQLRLICFNLARTKSSTDFTAHVFLFLNYEISARRYLLLRVLVLKKIGNERTRQRYVGAAVFRLDELIIPFQPSNPTEQIQKYSVRSTNPDTGQALVQPDEIGTDVECKYLTEARRKTAP